jgi:hypothetical protein
MRRSLLLLTLCLLVAACGSSNEPGPEPAVVPSEAVVRWLEAVENGDIAEATATTVDGSLAIVLALENGMDAGETADLVDDGVPDEMASSFWNSFAVEFVSFAGRPLSTLRVGEYTEFASEGATYAAVSITGRSDADAVVFTRLEDDGGWAVDLVATLGAGFLEVMERTYDSLPDSDDGGRVRDAYREVVAPSLWAALAAGDSNDDFTRDALGLLERIDAG